APGAPHQLWIVSSGRNALVLADAHLGHGLNQPSAGGICLLERLTEQLHLLPFLFRRNREAVRRLIGAIRRRAAPRAVDQLAAQEISSLAGLKTLSSSRRHTASVCLLLVERAGDAIGNELSEDRTRLSDRVRDAKA